MATTRVNHVELVNIDDALNCDVLYPKTTGEDVIISPSIGSASNDAIASDSKVLATLVNKFGSLAFAPKVTAGHLESGLLTTSTAITTPNTYIADAVAIKNLNTAINQLKVKTVSARVDGTTLVIRTNS